MFSPLSANIESILDRFDDAWNEATPPRIEDYLAEAQPDERHPLLIELVRIDLERRVAAGEKVRLEDVYLPRFPELFAEPPAIVTLVKHEFAVRHRNEPNLTPDEYLARFPQCQTELVAQLPTLDEIPNGERQQKTADAPAGLDLRGYELIETLGMGGMGEVYRCVDPSLGRDLAIKVMKADLLGQPEVERRFLREARVTGSLQHPGIVAIHNLGRLSDGRLHYTMRLVRGQTFADILKDEAGKPERLPYLLSIFEKICQAVAYAHSKRVIHRDLKPSNIMVGKFGEVQVMDWGLAKMLTPGDAADPDEPTDVVGTRIFTESAETPVDLSRMGSGMGTPAYMPPEQALGEWDTVDERADVFALGSILCEILTGKPVYCGMDSSEIFRRAKRGDVAEALERLQQCGADTALTLLCRECLSVHRENRPRDAGVVAQRVAEHQAQVQERLRQAEMERARAAVKAAEERKRRRWMLAAMLLLLAGVAVSTWQAVRATKAEGRALTSADAEREAREAEAEQRKQAEEQTRQAEANALEAKHQKELTEITLYYNQIALADREWLTNNILRAEAILDSCSPRLRRWEWHYLKRLCHTELLAHRVERGSVTTVVYSRDGKFLAFGGSDGVVRVFNAETGKAVHHLTGHRGPVTALAFCADVQSLASGGDDGVVKVWDLVSGQPQFEQNMTRIRFPPGKTDVKTPEAHYRFTKEGAVFLMTSPTDGHAMVSGVSFSPDGRRIVAAGSDGTAILWDRHSARKVFTIAAGPEELRGLTFNADGKQLAVLSNKITLWDAESGRNLLSLPLDSTEGVPRGIALSRDGKLLAVGTGLVAQVWSIRGGLHLRTFFGHTDLVNSLTFSSDCRRLATASADKTVKIWDVASGREIGSLRGHQRAITGVAFHPDGRRLASASYDGTIKIWDATTTQAASTVPGSPGIVYAITCSEDGRFVAHGGEDKVVRVWEIKTGRELLAIRGHNEMVTCLTYSSDGQHLASGSNDGTARLWDARTGKQVRIFLHVGGVHALAFSPDGKRLATASPKGTIKIWDISSGKEVVACKRQVGWLHGLAFSPDGKRLASASGSAQEAGKVAIWSAESGELILQMRGHPLGATSVSYSPDGKLLASGSYDDTAKLWDALLGREILTFPAAGQYVQFDPEGHRLATTSRQRVVKLWDPSTGREILALRGCTVGIQSLTYGFKGNYLVAASGGHGRKSEIRIWTSEKASSEDRESRRKALESGTFAWHQREAEDASRIGYWFAAACHTKCLLRVLAEKPALADDLNKGYRYSAACFAALSAAGRGNEADKLADRESADLRQQALQCLRSDLAAWGEQLDKARPVVQHTMSHWKRDPDLASVRDPQALDCLPDNERSAWQALWRDVDQLAKKAAKTKETKAAQKKTKP